MVVRLQERVKKNLRDSCEYLWRPSDNYNKAYGSGYEPQIDEDGRVVDGNMARVRKDWGSAYSIGYWEAARRHRYYSPGTKGTTCTICVPEEQWERFRIIE